MNLSKLRHLRLAVGILLLSAACTLPPAEAVFPPAIAVEPYADAGQMITGMTAAGDGSGRLFLTTRAGQIRILNDGSFEAEPFLDISHLVDSASIEQGLLGLAFDPDYAQRGEFYINYTNLETDNDTILARLRVSADPNRADLESMETILFVEQPANNHNGGHLIFGPDDYLYVGMGDGGPGNDRRGHAQNPEELLGKILRLDVRNQQTYAVPADNPFVGMDGYRPEIWALGLRNPWRFTFDPASGAFYLGDVGQEKVEELNFVADPGQGGWNFGWNVTEGSVCFNPAQGCELEGLTLPIYEYQHGEAGCSITAGVVYRGERHPGWSGTFFFGDFCTGFIFGAHQKQPGSWEIALLLDTDAAIVSFAEDEGGELYVLDLQGKIYRIVEGVAK